MGTIPRPNIGGAAASQPRRRLIVRPAAALIALILLLTLAIGFARTRLLTQVDQLNSLIAAEQHALDTASLSPATEEGVSSKYHQLSANGRSVAPTKAKTTAGLAPQGAIVSSAATAHRMTAPDSQTEGADYGVGERAANGAAGDEATEREDHAAAIAAARNAVQGHPEILLSLLESKPAVENGDVRGFRVMPVADPAFMELLGLRAGDILSSVNGITLDAPDHGLEKLSDLSGIDMLTFMLWRDNQLEVVKYVTGQ